MRLTRAGEYAIRCLLYLASQEPGKVISRREIITAMQIPDQFLRKIAQQLARAKFIEIIQGPRGGYRLLTEPEKLTLLDVVEAMGGEIVLNECVLRPEFCFRSEYCSVHRVWKRATEQLRRTLAEASFAALVKEGSCANIIEKG